MGEESMQVLRMLAEGKITVDQANQLLDALGEEPPAAVERVETPKENRQRPGTRAPAKFTLEQIIELSEHEVDPTFILRLRQAGLTDLTVDQIIELSEHEVDADFVVRLRKAGLTDLTVDQIVELSEHEIDPRFILQLREAGLADLSFDQIIELSEHGVDPALIRAMQELNA